MRPGWPNWANFRILDDYFIWAFFWKITQVDEFLCYFFLQKIVCINFIPTILYELKMDLATFWAIFVHKLIWSPWLRHSISLADQLFGVMILLITNYFFWTASSLQMSFPKVGTCVRASLIVFWNRAARNNLQLGLRKYSSQDLALIFRLFL
jgi:hypothetical protein